RVCDLMNAKYRIAVDESQRKMNVAISTTYLPRAYFVYDARILSDDAQQKAFMESDAFIPSKTVVLDDDPHFPLTSSSDSVAGSVTITSYRLNSIALDVTAPHNGFLVLSEVYYPGWHAYDNGMQSPIYRGDWNLRAIPVREGKHSIEVRFEPDSFRHGEWITAATIGLSFIGIVYSVVKKRSKPPSA
ncbi:MAG TPA: YfhO family protein, partial [Bacteroidota bacterium]|nr:YfhO family protein [Bacteroidota bacterium]